MPDTTSELLPPFPVLIVDDVPSIDGLVNEMIGLAMQFAADAVVVSPESFSFSLSIEDDGGRAGAEWEENLAATALDSMIFSLFQPQPEDVFVSISFGENEQEENVEAAAEVAPETTAETPAEENEGKVGNPVAKNPEELSKAIVQQAQTIISEAAATDDIKSERRRLSTEEGEEAPAMKTRLARRLMEVVPQAPSHQETATTTTTTNEQFIPLGLGHDADRCIWRVFREEPNALSRSCFEAMEELSHNNAYHSLSHVQVSQPVVTSSFAYFYTTDEVPDKYYAFGVQMSSVTFLVVLLAFIAFCFSANDDDDDDEDDEERNETDVYVALVPADTKEKDAHPPKEQMFMGVPILVV